MDPIDVNNKTVTETKHRLEKIVTEINPNMSLHDFRMTPAGEKRTNLIFDVVVPTDFKLSHEELESKIKEKAYELNPTFRCVITFDNDFSACD